MQMNSMDSHLGKYDHSNHEDLSDIKQHQDTRNKTPTKSPVSSHLPTLGNKFVRKDPVNALK